MAVPGFEREEWQAPLAEINTTPLVDVMLVLMTIFLVTAPMLTQAVPLELPKERAANIQGARAVTVSVSASGEYYLGETRLEPDGLERRLLAMAARNPAQPVHVRADAGVPYGKVGHALAAMQRAGLTNIELLMQPEQGR